MKSLEIFDRYRAIATARRKENERVMDLIEHALLGTESTEVQDALHELARKVLAL